MTKEYTIEELKEKVISQFIEKGIEFGASDLTGGYIDDSFYKVLECFDSAFKEILKTT